MVVDKCQPALLWIWCSHRSAKAQVLRHGSRRNPDAELQLQLVGDALLAPRRILDGHLSGQSLEVAGQPRSSRRFGLAAPEEPESLTMPSDEGIGFDDHQRHPPMEQPTDSGHQPPGSVAGPVWFDLRSWKSANCFRRNRFSAANAARGRTARRAALQCGEIGQRGQHERSGSHVLDVRSCERGCGPSFCGPQD